MNLASDRPDPNKLSIIMAVIVLAFSLTRLIPVAESTQINLAGFLINFRFGFGTIIAILTSVLSIAGVNWLLADHPYTLQHEVRWFQNVLHWILPVFSAFVISITLNNMAQSTSWWLVLGVSSLFLTLVFVGEYRVFDPTNPHHPLASIALISLSYAEFLILTIALRTVGARLYIYIPVLLVACYLIALRVLFIRSKGSWLFDWVLVIALCIGGAGTGLYYLPVGPIPSALFLLATLYGLTILFSGLHQKKEHSALWAEPLSMFLLVSLIAVITLL